MNTQTKLFLEKLIFVDEIDLVLGYHIEDEIISETLSFLGFEIHLKELWVCTILPLARH